MLDLATLLTISGVLAALLLITITFTMNVAAPRSRASLRIWQLALACNALFWFLYLGDYKLFPDKLPHSLAIIAVNGASLAAALAYVWAFRRFMGLPNHHRLLAGLLIGNLFANLLLSAFWNEYAWRLLFNLGMTAALLFWLSGSLWRFRETGVTSAARMSMLVFGLGALAILSRLYDLYFGTQVDALTADFGRTAALLGFALIPCFGTIGFLLMHVGRASAQLEKLADTDPLTGAHNRRSLETLGRKALSSAKRHRQSLSVLMIDADHFKRINDQHGHEAGDKALVGIMSTLSNTLRDEDIIGRVGGEEFVVVLPATDDQGAIDVGERVRRAIEAASIDLNDMSLSLTVSIGSATTSGAASALDELIRLADQALYEAKTQGRNRLVHRASPNAAPSLDTNNACTASKGTP